MVKEKLLRNGKVRVRVIKEGQSDCFYSIRPTNDPHKVYFVNKSGSFLGLLFGLEWYNNPFISLQKRIQIAIDKAEKDYNNFNTEERLQKEEADREILEEVS